MLQPEKAGRGFGVYEDAGGAVLTIAARVCANGLLGGNGLRRLHGERGGEGEEQMKGFHNFLPSHILPYKARDCKLRGFA